MEEVKYSCIPETKYYKFNFMVLSLVGINLFIILVIVLTAAKIETSVIFSTSLVVFLFFGLFAFYYYLRYRYYSNLEPAYVQIVKLDKVIPTYSGLLAFEVEMEIDSKLEKVDTLAIFNSGIIKINPIDKYSNKTVRVGYDKRFKVCVVLEIIE
jgi:phosphoglycerol transferase MdoB-like AlkP superfamily enzyme